MACCHFTRSKPAWDAGESDSRTDMAPRCIKSRMYKYAFRGVRHGRPSSLEAHSHLRSTPRCCGTALFTTHAALTLTTDDITIYHVRVLLSCDPGRPRARRVSLAARRGRGTPGPSWCEAGCLRPSRAVSARGHRMDQGTEAQRHLVRTLRGKWKHVTDTHFASCLGIFLMRLNRSPTVRASSSSERAMQPLRVRLASSLVP